MSLWVCVCVCEYVCCGYMCKYMHKCVCVSEYVCCVYMCKYMPKCVCLASSSVALRLESLACGKHILVQRLWAALGPVGQPVGVISLSATGSADTPRGLEWLSDRVL